MSTAVPVIRHRGEGERRWFAGGGIITVKATAAETGESLLLFEHQSTRGKMTPLHSHPHEEETLYVLDGEIVVYIEGAEHRVGAGGLAVAPRGVPHAFCVTSATARVLTLLTPGNGESFFRDASDPVTDDADAGRQPDFDRLRAVAARNSSIDLLGPPPFKEATPTAAEAAS